MTAQSWEDVDGLGIVTLPHSIALCVAARIFGSEPRLGLQVIFRACTYPVVPTHVCARQRSYKENILSRRAHLARGSLKEIEGQ